MSSDSLENRVRELMEMATPKQRRFKQLEEWTEIAADRWSAVSLGRQRPTAEMIEALCTRFPDMALWITTGKTDVTNKQWDARTSLARRETSLFAVLSKTRDQLTESDRLVLRAALSLALPMDDAERKAASALVGDISDLLMTEGDYNKMHKEFDEEVAKLRKQSEPKKPTKSAGKRAIK